MHGTRGKKIDGGGTNESVAFSPIGRSGTPSSCCIRAALRYPHLICRAPAARNPAPAARLKKSRFIHFHGNQQCTSCIAVGDLAEKTVNANFKDELASGRLVFAHVNYDLPENAALATKYNVTGSSLWIGIYDANGFHKEQDSRGLVPDRR